MPQLNYKGRFAKLVKEGKKPHTIRADRKRPIKVGDDLYHFSGMQTKACERLLTNKCTRVQPIWIHQNGNVLVGDKALLPAEVEKLALDDGFNSTKEFFEFFVTDARPTFKGTLIWWI
jgi:hypothetical protein